MRVIAGVDIIVETIKIHKLKKRVWLHQHLGTLAATC